LNGQPAVLQVVILRDGLLVGTEVFVPGSYVLGSSSTADLRLDDPAVKPQHATLYFHNGKVAVQDSAAAGVFVNGHKVNACEVRPVDEITCGPFVLKTRILAQRPAAKAAPPADVAALLKGAPAPNPSPVRTALPPARANASPLPGFNPPLQKPSSPPATPSGRKPLIAKAPTPGIGGTIPSARALGSPPAAAAVPKNGRPVPAFARSELPRGENGIISGRLLDEVARPRSSMPIERRAATRRPVTHGTSRRTKHIDAPPISADAKGAPRLYLELYWGDRRRDARSFAQDKRPLTAAARDGAQFSLWGFDLPEEDFVLAESEPSGFRLYAPPGSAVEKKKGEHFFPLGIREMESDGGRAFVPLSKGAAIRLTNGEMTLLAYVATKPARVFVNPLRGVPWLLLFFLTSFGGGFVYFLLYGPKPGDMADFAGRNLPPVAIRLIAPQPKKKEQPPKQLEAIKEEAPPKEDKPPKKEEKKKIVRERPTRRQPEHKVVVAEPPPPPENKALKALAKLSAAGPATGNILAAVDKLGSGPGSKNAKNNYKLSGLIGKAPIANAGLGTFGLGGGGRGGAGMLGAEILRGKGGAGIGAMGAGGVGRGAVGGTVTRASAHSVSVQGNIDREAVAKVVNAHLQEVRACYERALLREPALAGKVVLEWTISQGGKVTSTKTKSSTLKSSAVEACILESLKSWQFPPARGGIVIVSYPFLFNSVGY